jgi:hypothetical protein
VNIWLFAAIWTVVGMGYSANNAHRWIIRWPEVYWLGAALWVVGGIIAAAYQPIEVVSRSAMGAAIVGAWLEVACTFPRRQRPKGAMPQR